MTLSPAQVDVEEINRRGRTVPSVAARLAAASLAAALVLGPAAVADAKPRPKTDATSTSSSISTATSTGQSPTSEADLDGAMSLLEVAEAIGATDLWAEGVTGEGVDVAIIDTGVAPVPGLTGVEVVVGPDLSFEAGIPELSGLDTYGHGTHLAGIIGADAAGIAPDSRLVSVKVGDNTGAVDVSQVIAAIDWVVANRTTDGLDIRVLNLSYNTSSSLGYIDDPLSRAVENAWRSGIVVVVSAGNDGRGVEELANPANNPYVIAVAAAEQKGNGEWKVPSWGTRGDGTRNPDLTAPGSSIASLRVPGSRIDSEHPEGRIEGHDALFRGSGTSQAAAVVSGAAALLLDDNPDLTPDQVKALLTTTAIDIHNDDRRQGHGLLDVHGAANAAIPGDAVQSWTPAVGGGTLEAARGADQASPTGSSWTGSSWTGSSWTGSSWTGSSWTGSSWTGSSWTGSSWTGSSWTGSSWTGSSWG